MPKIYQPKKLVPFIEVPSRSVEAYEEPEPTVLSEHWLENSSKNAKVIFRKLDNGKVEVERMENCTTVKKELLTLEYARGRYDWLVKHGYTVPF